jgi:thioredoxin reductase
VIDDVVVVGGGPAGLSAALVLARAGLSVRVVDGGAPRNAATHAMHGMIGFEGASPAAFRERVWAELSPLGVALEQARAASIERRGELAVALDDGRTLSARRVLLAVGLVDQLPKLPGMKECWGKSAFSCPHCHGHEHRGRRWGLLAIQRSMVGMAPSYRPWTTALTLLLDGRTDVEAARLDQLAARGIAAEPRKITALEHEGGQLRGLRLADGALLELDATLLHPPQRQTDLVLFAGLKLDDEGAVKVDESFATSMPGVHAAGDLTGGSARAIAAAAQGAQAAVAMVEGWIVEDRAL